MSFLFLFIIIMIFLNLKLEIKISNFQYDNKMISEDFNISFILKLNNKIKFTILNLNKRKIREFITFKMIKDVDLDVVIREKNNLSLLINKIKKLDIEIEKVDFQLYIGCQNMMITTVLVPTISTILSVLNLNLKNINYEVNSIYNENRIKIFLNLEFQLKVWRIINFLIFIFKTRK